MKQSFKYLITLVVVVFLNIEPLLSVPAIRQTITLEQPDGSSLDIRVHGDEYFNWRSTTDGQTISEVDGYYYYSRYNQSGEAEVSPRRVKEGGRVQPIPSGYRQSRGEVSAISSLVASNRRKERNMDSSSSTMSRVSTLMSSSSSSSSYNAYPSTLPSELKSSLFPTKGEDIKTIILLVEFSDVKFSLLNANTNFYNHLNEIGYTSSNGAMGSARDYFLANSNGAFDCQFDVYGPYTLDNNVAYYGKNGTSGFDSNPQTMVIDAAKKAVADGVDFSQYDLDSDGYIDNIFIYYAGYNEAEGGSSDSIWAHKWAAPSSTSFSGKWIYDYACASELSGFRGTTMAGIGTFCHEFGHVLGLYDHYDTDGDTDGESYGLYTYDIMSYGNYNNSSNTPPLYNALELIMVGWAEAQSYGTAGSVTQQPISSGEIYRIDTDVEDEFFLIENRQSSASVWDEYIESDGLLITHVDMSSAYHSSWLANGPNNNPSHECFKIIPANNADLNSSFNVWGNICYPLYNATSWDSTSTPRAESWSGADLSYNLSSIALSDVNVTYAVESSDYTVTVWQIDALITWDNNYYDSCKVVITSSDGSKVGDWYSASNSVVIDGLEAASTYNFSLYGLSSDGDYNIFESGKFTTLSQNSSTPLIALANYTYSLGSDIYLKTLNISTSDTLAWWVDGVRVDEGYYTLSKSGEITIKCLIEGDERCYVVIKKIMVQ